MAKSSVIYVGAVFSAEPSRLELLPEPSMGNRTRPEALAEYRPKALAKQREEAALTPFFGVVDNLVLLDESDAPLQLDPLDWSGDNLVFVGAQVQTVLHVLAVQRMSRGQTVPVQTLRRILPQSSFCRISAPELMRPVFFDPFRAVVPSSLDGFEVMCKYFKWSDMSASGQAMLASKVCREFGIQVAEF